MSNENLENAEVSTLSGADLDARLEAERAKTEQLLEDLRKKDLIAEQQKKQREILAKLNPASKENPGEYDTSKAVSLDYVPPSQAKRYSFDQFPDNPAEIREIVRKHALKQMESTKRNKQVYLRHIEDIAKHAVELVENGKKKAGPEFVGGGTRRTPWTKFDRHARIIRERCGVLGIMPIFSEVEAVSM